MGVEWIRCNKCENNFPDCGEYVRCQTCSEQGIGIYWCNDDCATADGHGVYLEDASTGKWVEVDEYDPYHAELLQALQARELEKFGKVDTEYFNDIWESCHFCRGDDASDEELLVHAMSLLRMTRRRLLEDYLAKQKRKAA